jgi:hypothetical protein
LDARAVDAVHLQLTAADERAYTGYAGAEQHKGFEVIDVAFGAPPETGGAPDD